MSIGSDFFKDVDNFLGENLPGYDGPFKAMQRQRENEQKRSDPPFKKNTFVSFKNENSAQKQKREKIVDLLNATSGGPFRNETPEQKLRREKLERLPEYRKYALIALVSTLAIAIISVVIFDLFLAMVSLILVGPAAVTVSDFNKITENMEDVVQKDPGNLPEFDLKNLKRKLWVESMKNPDERKKLLDHIFQGTFILPLFAK